MLDDLRENIGGARLVAGGKGFLGERHGFGDRRGARRRGRRELGDELLHLAFGNGALESVDRPAVAEGIDRRNRLDAHLRRQLFILVDVDLDHAHGAFGLAHGLFQRRAELLAGTAPFRPEIDDDRDVMRRVDHVGHEGLGRAVLNEVGVGPGSRAADDRFHVVCLVSLETP